MPANSPGPGTPQDWLRHARGDLAIARARRRRGWLYEHQCFHAQQAAEKALKAVLVQHRIPAPRSHDLAFLLSQIPTSARLPVELIELPILNKYAVQLRYPGESPVLTVQDRRTAVKLATCAPTWAERVVRHA